MEHMLYGDGIHDDRPAIQEMLDSGKSLVYLPTPRVNYAIGDTLYVHTNQELRLDRYTRIKLLDNSNCAMLKNADPENWDKNIVISGGIWDMNHSKQWPNPAHFPNPETGETINDVKKRLGWDYSHRQYMPTYFGHCFMFNSIHRLEIKSLTIENPVVYGIQLAHIDDFTVEDIYFDFYEGSPKLWNLDGIHVEGGCKNGLIKNLKGQCHDDLVAITTDDFCYGPIDNITVDGIYSEGSHSAVRLLSWGIPLKNVHITNVYGSYYAYCINISKYWGAPEDRGIMENISIDHIYARICKGTIDVAGNKEPLIVVKPELHIGNLSLCNIYREEIHCPTPTIGIGRDTHIRQLTVDNVEQMNMTDTPIILLENNAKIDKLYLRSLHATENDILFLNNGEIGQQVNN